MRIQTYLWIIIIFCEASFRPLNKVEYGRESYTIDENSALLPPEGSRHAHPSLSLSTFHCIFGLHDQCIHVSQIVIFPTVIFVFIFHKLFLLCGLFSFPLLLMFIHWERELLFSTIVNLFRIYIAGLLVFKLLNSTWYPLVSVPDLKVR